MSLDPGRVAAWAGADSIPAAWQPSFNIAPGRSAPIVRTSFSGRRELALARWGLVPARAARPPPRPAINARLETVRIRPSFRHLLRRQRCLVPADGFYEWLRGPAGRTPYRVVPAVGEAFAFAGLWDRWRTAEGAFRETFVVLTTAANERIAPIHDRMPVILDEGERARWVSPENPLEDPDGFPRPCPPETLRVFPVRSLVNSARCDSPECAQPLPEPLPGGGPAGRPRQGCLF